MNAAGKALLVLCAFATVIETAAQPARQCGGPDFVCLDALPGSVDSLNLGDAIHPLVTMNVTSFPARGNPNCLAPQGEEKETRPGKTSSGSSLFYALSTKALSRSLGISFGTTLEGSIGSGPLKGKQTNAANISTKRSLDEEQIDFYYVYGLFESYGRIGRSKPFKPDSDLAKRFRANPRELITECGTHYVEAIDRATTVWLIVKLNGVARDDLRTLDATVSHESELEGKIKVFDIGSKSKVQATLNEFVRRKSSTVTYTAFTYASGTSEVPPVLLSVANNAIDFAKLETWLNKLYEQRKQERANAFGDAVRYHLRPLSDIYPDGKSILAKYKITRTQIEAIERLTKSRSDLTLAYASAQLASKDAQSQVRTLFQDPDGELKVASSAISAELDRVDQAIVSCAQFSGRGCSYSPTAIPQVLLLLPPPQPAGRFEVRGATEPPLPSEWTYAALRKKEPLEKQVLNSFPKMKDFWLEYVVEAIRPNAVRFVFVGSHNGVALVTQLTVPWDTYSDKSRCRLADAGSCWRFPTSPGGTNLNWTGLAQTIAAWSKALPTIGGRDEEVTVTRIRGPDMPRAGLPEMDVVHKGNWTRNSGDGIVYAEVVNRYGVTDRLPIYQATWNYYTYSAVRNKRPPPNANDLTLAIP